MSSFQIPGLGQAKPNETLPPLPHGEGAEVGTSTEVDEPMNDAQPVDTKVDTKDNEQTNPPVANATSNTETAANPAPEPVQVTESMVVDRPESPPSLTDVMEAALDGLDKTAPEASNPQPATDAISQAPAQAQEQQPPLENDQGENPEWELDSSPYESSSDSSSDSSDDDDNSENEGYELLGVEETARLLMEAEGGSDDEGDGRGKGSGSGQVRTKNELPEEIIPKPDVTITPEMKIEELGVVESVVENIILIKAFTPGEYQVLDTGSVLCNGDRTVIGVVTETIGKVLQPLYVVYFNSPEELKELNIEVGTKIFYPVDHASYVFTEPLKNMKGSDASNLHDEEVGDDEMEFSDDEKEAEYKRSLKQKKKDKWKNSGKGAKEPHPLRQETRADGGLNYDDAAEDDGPYKPLARPPGYGDGPVSSESYDSLPSRPNFQHGRRGDSRGRGRGRGSGRGGRGGYGQPRDGYSMPPQGHHQQSAPQPAPTASWGAFPPPPPPPGQGAAPALPNFGFQMPGWPQQAQGGQGSLPIPPPPPPGWPAQGQAQGQAGANNAYMNPAFLAALMSQMQQAAQNGQPQWPGQQPPNGGQGQ